MGPKPVCLFIACKSFRQAATHGHPFGRLTKFALLVLFFRPPNRGGDNKHKSVLHSHIFAWMETNHHPLVVSIFPPLSPARRYPTPRNATIKIVLPRLKLSFTPARNIICLPRLLGSQAHTHQLKQGTAEATMVASLLGPTPAPTVLTLGGGNGSKKKFVSTVWSSFG